MEESLFINLDGNNNLLDLIKKYQQRMKGENPNYVDFSGECQQETHQLGGGKKKERDDFKNNYAIDFVPSAVHGKKSCPNLGPRGGNPSRTKAVHAAEWVKREGVKKEAMKKTTNRTTEGLPRGAGLKLQRGRALLGRPNLAAGNRSSCSSDTRKKGARPTHGGDCSVLPTQEAAHENEKNEQQGKLKKSEINLKNKSSVKEKILDNRTFEEKLVHVERSVSPQRVKEEFLNGSDIKTKELEPPNGWSTLGSSSLCMSHLDTISKSKHKINAMKSGKMFLCSSESKAPREEYLLREVRLKKGAEMRLTPSIKTDLLENCAAVFAFVRSQLRRVNSALTGGRSTGGCRSTGGSRSTGTTSPTKFATKKGESVQRDYLRRLRRNVKKNLEELRRTSIVAFILSVLPEKGSSSCTPTCSVKRVGRPHMPAMRVGGQHIPVMRVGRPQIPVMRVGRPQIPVMRKNP
ncbi:hypothetical protein PCYB_133380 [Plasmodium cynomolgi strain B]|uniref:Uncharacterized protein n=1 Tax=Plasmodium cynomolgi (strain B) TaxID=1120755 RepID=K6UXH0_PLACD|nr:hypothetical protein PCYB_133380 [Plasmodium cynomolgi strain B]GAB68464.1 hypothetical protein PCYB_133380 [Plasmodium cynomolgi strain B]